MTDLPDRTNEPPAEQHEPARGGVYPYSDCCPNLPGAGESFSPCGDGWCCTHETRHGVPPFWSAQKQPIDEGQFQREVLGMWPPDLQRCPACSRPSTSIRDQGGDGLTVARQWLPCGCTRIVPAGGDR